MFKTHKSIIITVFCIILKLDIGIMVFFSDLGTSHLAKALSYDLWK